MGGPGGGPGGVVQLLVFAFEPVKVCLICLWAHLDPINVVMLTTLARKTVMLTTLAPKIITSLMLFRKNRNSDDF